MLTNKANRNNAWHTEVLIVCCIAFVPCYSSSAADTASADNLLAARRLYRAHKYPQAEAMLVFSLRNAQQSGQSEMVTSCLSTLADVYQKEGKLAEAEQSLALLMRLHEKALWPEHPYVSDIRYRLEELYLKQRKYSAAEPLMKRDVELDETVVGKEDPQTIRDLNRLMLCYRGMAKFPEMEAVARRILAVQQTNDVLGQLAVACVKQAKIADCKPPIQQLLSSPAEDHINQAIDFCFLGTELSEYKEYSLSEQLLKRFLKRVPSTAEGDYALLSASALECLARIKNDEHEHKSAVTYLKQAIQARRQWKGNPASLPGVQSALKADEELLSRLSSSESGLTKPRP